MITLISNNDNITSTTTTTTTTTINFIINSMDVVSIILINKIKEMADCLGQLMYISKVVYVSSQ